MDKKQPLIVWSKGRVDVPGMNILFGPGPNEVTSPDVMRVMLRFPMPLEFKVQDMVDLGYLTAAEVVSFGYEAFDREAGEVVEGPVTAKLDPPEGRPKFSAMNMIEVKKWAQEHEVVLKLTGAVPWDKQECVEACEKRADELGLPKGTKNLMKPPEIEEPEPNPGTDPEPKEEKPADPEPKPPKKTLKKKGKGK